MRLSEYQPGVAVSIQRVGDVSPHKSQLRSNTGITLSPEPYQKAGKTKLYYCLVEMPDQKREVLLARLRRRGSHDQS